MKHLRWQLQDVQIPVFYKVSCIDLLPHAVKSCFRGFFVKQMKIKLHFVLLWEAEIFSKSGNAEAQNGNSRVPHRPEFNHKHAIKSPIKSEGREFK